jgi:antitoxin component HigA of HigAB toxin-antitoxin module
MTTKILKRYISKLAFARLCGVSDAAIHRAIREGKIPVFSIKGSKFTKIDRLHPDSILYQESDRPSYLNPSNRQKFTQGEDFLDDQTVITDQANDQPVVVDQTNAGLIKIYESIRHSRVKTAKEQSSVVNRNTIAKLCIKMYKIETDEWEKFPQIAMPEITEIFEKENENTNLKIERLLKQKIRAILKHLRRLVLDYIEEIESDLTIDHERP